MSIRGDRYKQAKRQRHERLVIRGSLSATRRMSIGRKAVAFKSKGKIT